MHIRQLQWQLQLTTYFTSLLQNLEWCNEPRCEFTTYLEMAQTSHTANSYPNFFHIAGHKLSSYLLGSNLLFRSDHQSEDDK
jgi:hypothetical protein